LKGASAGVLGGFEQDVGAENVGGHQVRGELDAAVLQPQGAGDGPNQERLAQARQTFEQDVAAGQQGDRHAADDQVLADDDAGDLALERVDGRAQALEVVGGLGGRLGGSDNVHQVRCLQSAAISAGKASSKKRHRK
jgi:hypothetical protein